jgi:hypothetical protein
VTRYAADTSVSVEKSRMEIERTLARYGADAFAYFAEAERAMIGFRMGSRQIKFVLILPKKDLHEFTHHSRGERTPEGALAAWEQACRQRWRALALVIKAKLEAVAAGITTIEDEFLAHTVLPDGSTVGEWARPQLEEAYRIGAMPTALLLAGPR